MQSLAELVQENRQTITRRLYLGKVYWEQLLEKLERWEHSPRGVFNDEQVWTFLVACGYAIAGAEGVARLTKTLTGAVLPQPDDSKIWMEVLPLPPRESEGNTNLDLAVGAVAGRGSTKSGIELSRSSTGWICFCEMKWDSDISLSVSYDPNRNQLARVIETALCFQRSGVYTSDVYISLVTPAKFKEAGGQQKAYQGKFREYDADRAALLKDLNACVLEKYGRSHWYYPADIAERVNRLSLRWPTHEDLFAGIPDSNISEGLARFWERYGYRTA